MVAEPIRQDLFSGVKLGVMGTPTLFINGRRVSGLRPLEVLEGFVRDELQRSQQPGPASAPGSGL